MGGGGGSSARDRSRVRQRVQRQGFGHVRSIAPVHTLVRNMPPGRRNSTANFKACSVSSDCGIRDAECKNKEGAHRIEEEAERASCTHLAVRVLDPCRTNVWGTVVQHDIRLGSSNKETRMSDGGSATRHVAIPGSCSSGE
jgi:hypothetical protein